MRVHLAAALNHSGQKSAKQNDVEQRESRLRSSDIAI